MSLRVVVVEAATKSGSPITARFAVEQGGKVFAVPSSPRDPMRRALARRRDADRDGVGDRHTMGRSCGSPRCPSATQARSTHRDLTLVAPSLGPALASVDGDAGLEMILEKLSPTPVAVDEPARQCQLSAAAVATLLLEPELAGRIECHPGNLVSRR